MFHLYRQFSFSHWIPRVFIQVLTHLSLQNNISNYVDSILLPSFFLSQALIVTLKHLLLFVLQEFLKARCWGLLFLFLWWSILLFLSQLLTKTEFFKLFENLSTMELWLEVVSSLFFFNSYTLVVFHHMPASRRKSISHWAETLKLSSFH